MSAGSWEAGAAAAIDAAGEEEMRGVLVVLSALQARAAARLGAIKGGHVEGTPAPPPAKPDDGPRGPAPAWACGRRRRPGGVRTHEGGPLALLRAASPHRAWSPSPPRSPSPSPSPSLSPSPAARGPRGPRRLGVEGGAVGAAGSSAAAQVSRRGRRIRAKAPGYHPALAVGGPRAGAAQGTPPPPAPPGGGGGGDSPPPAGAAGGGGDGVPGAVGQEYRGRSSRFRGVCQHRWTGRWDAHLWDSDFVRKQPSKGRSRGRQVYVGNFLCELDASRGYDRASLVWWGPGATLNHPLEDYARELPLYEALGRDEAVPFLRHSLRHSPGVGGAARFTGVFWGKGPGQFEARLPRPTHAGAAGQVPFLFLGTFGSEEDAARAHDRACIAWRPGDLAGLNFPPEHYLSPGEASRLRQTGEPPAGFEASAPGLAVRADPPSADPALGTPRQAADREAAAAGGGGRGRGRGRGRG